MERRAMDPDVALEGVVEGESPVFRQGTNDAEWTEVSGV
jgi:hypothetical protein